MRDPEEFPVRLSSLETDKEMPMRFRHVGHHRGNDCLTRGFKIGKGNRFLRHAD
jgi:hypothetical protein